MEPCVILFSNANRLTVPKMIIGIQYNPRMPNEYTCYLNISPKYEAMEDCPDPAEDNLMQLRLPQPAAGTHASTLWSLHGE